LARTTAPVEPVASLLTAQGALLLAWDGIEHGLLPGYLDRTVRALGRGLQLETQGLLILQELDGRP
jgi:hypothetical protein